MRSAMSFRKSKIPWTARSLCVLALLPLLVTASRAFPGQDKAVQLESSSECSRPDPFGNIVESDRSKGEKRAANERPSKTIQLRSARNGYVSFHLIVKSPQGGPYS